MQGAARLDGGGARRQQLGIGVEAAILDRRVHPGQVLVDDAPGANVHVADLGIAHLALRQADVAALGVHQGVRAVGQQPPPVRQVGLGQGIVGRRLLTMAPAVQDQQEHGLGTGRHGTLLGERRPQL